LSCAYVILLIIGSYVMLFCDWNLLLVAIDLFFILNASKC